MPSGQMDRLILLLVRDAMRNKRVQFPSTYPHSLSIPGHMTSYFLVPPQRSFWYTNTPVPKCSTKGISQERRRIQISRLHEKEDFWEGGDVPFPPSQRVL